MDCKETRELLPAHVDQELSLPAAIEIDKHLQSCPACQKKFAEQRALRAAIKKQAAYYNATDHIEARLKAALFLGEEQAVQSAKRARGRFGSLNWFNLGAALASVVAITWSIGLYLAQPSARDVLAEEVVSSHVRSLMMNHIADVASSDQHTVKPWFNGKLDFSPAVNDFAGQGFPLVGGRLDYLDHRSVAALVYRYRQHLINVYIWPDAKERQTAGQTLSRQGYHLVHWSAGGMVYWVISDLDPRELLQLTHLLQT